MGDRTLKQLAAPNVDNEQPLCIRYTNPVVPFELKSRLIHLLPKFHGLAGEDPHKHLKEFHIVCNTMKPTGMDEEQIKLRAFPFSLDSGAKDWLYYLPPSSIVSWNDMARLFLEKFFPSSRATSIRKEISGIRQANGENMHEYWERFKRLCSSCPHHQIPDNLLLVYFYEGLLPMDGNLLDAASGGVLSNKTPNEAKELIAEIAANAQQFGTRASSSAVFQVQTSPMQNPIVAAAGASSTDNQRIENRLDELTSMVRQLAVTQTVQPSAQQTNNPCGICCDPSHPTDACPSLHDSGSQVDQSVAAVFPENPQHQQQQQNNPFSNTYNPGWKNHPNLIWNQNQQNAPYQSQQNLPFQQRQQFVPPQQRQNFQQFAPQQPMQQQPPTVPNPKGTGNVSAISLRSGKQLEEPNQSAVKSSQGGDTGSRKQNTNTSDVHIPLPFPQRATQSKKQAAKAQDKEILDTFRKVEVNIPLLDAIQQIPRYAKFLKELCTNKRRLKGDERVSVSQNVSALIQPMPKKCHDPGTFTIPCIIGNSIFHDCMLDLGASINVMHKSVYKSLGLGPLRATGIVIQLANRSSVHPSGVVEDILVRVNNLIFPADFYVLGMEGEIPSSTIILGRPFMKTARTKIDVHAGTLSLEFGDSMVNFNIFDVMKFPREEHSIFYMDVIDEMMDDISTDLTAEYPELSSLLDSALSCDCTDSSNCTACAEIALCCSDFNHVLNDDLHSGSALVLNSELPVEIIEGSISENLIAGIDVNVFSAEPAPTRLLPSTEQPLKLEVKDLPDHLKYAYLEENEQLPVIVAKTLLPESEEKLLTLPIQADIIYPISDSWWVNPFQVVPKKSRVTVMANPKNELVPARAQNSLR
ncbi:uncharacterized protein LOC133307724, partial [Gastrolobium bilobum]|uniref:uncharacterized protein LOC133307724 n=1 Tax=Gastrolobium bilobum TaxID=150636 RepID=UPI002AB0F3C2